MRDDVIEEPLVGLARHADEGEGRRSEIELKEAPALDGAVVVVALLLRLGEDLISAVVRPTFW